MKSISSLDLGILIREWDLINGKIDKIFQIKKEEFYFVFHVPSLGKRILYIGLPGLMYLTSKRVIGDSMAFGLFLRKFLSNARLRSVIQVGFDPLTVLILEMGRSVLLISTHFVPEFLQPGKSPVFGPC